MHADLQPIHVINHSPCGIFKGELSWVSQAEGFQVASGLPLMMPFSCSVFMEGRLMMNFLSRFFTPLLSALSEVLCFSLELVNMSERK